MKMVKRFPFERDLLRDTGSNRHHEVGGGIVVQSASSDCHGLAALDDKVDHGFIDC